MRLTGDKETGVVLFFRKSLLAFDNAEIGAETP
jgi:hypothetical protein